MLQIIIFFLNSFYYAIRRVVCRYSLLPILFLNNQLLSVFYYYFQVKNTIFKNIFNLIQEIIVFY